MRFSENCAIETRSDAEAGRDIVLLSMVQITESSLDFTLMSVTAVSGTTNGLTFKLCGEIGSMMRTLDAGEHIGPPALREYAVEPELVATISPSAQ